MDSFVCSVSSPKRGVKRKRKSAWYSMYLLNGLGGGGCGQRVLQNEITVSCHNTPKTVTHRLLNAFCYDEESISFAETRPPEDAALK